MKFLYKYPHAEFPTLNWSKKIAAMVVLGSSSFPDTGVFVDNR
jgi:hypothetical protein